MPTAASGSAGGAPASPAGAPLHGERTSSSECQSSETLRSSLDGNRSFDTNVAAGLLAVKSGRLAGWQHEEPGHQKAGELGGPAAWRGDSSVGKGRSSSTTWDAGCSSSQPPRVFSWHTTTDSPRQEPPASGQTFDFLESGRLPALAELVEQRPTSTVKLQEKLRSLSPQRVRVTEGVLQTDTMTGGEAVTAENAGTASEAAALESSIPSVLITSPSLGRISVLCAPVASRSTQAAYTAGKPSASIWGSQEDSEEEVSDPSLATGEAESERRSAAHVSIAPTLPASPSPSVSSSNGGGNRLWLGATSVDGERRPGEDGGWGDKDAARLETGYFVEGARQIPPNGNTECVASCGGGSRPFESEVTTRRHSGRGVVDHGATASSDNQQLEAVAMQSDRKLESAAAFRYPHLLEHPSASHTHPSRSISPETAGRSGRATTGRHRRVYPAGSQRGHQKFVAQPGAAPGDENERPSQDGAGGSDTRRRFSLPPEGTLSAVIRSGGIVTPSVTPVTQGVPGRREPFRWTERSMWTSHESRVKDGLGKKSRRQSVDLVRSDHEGTDLRFLRQSFPSENGGKEERSTVLVGGGGRTAAAAAVAPREGFSPGEPLRQTRGGADDALTLDRIAACNERRNSRTWTRAFEERSQGASRDHLAAPGLPQSAAGRDQGISRLQQPLLSTAFRAAAHAAAAAARVRTSAVTSGGKKIGVAATGGRDVPNVAAASVAHSSLRDTSASLHVNQGTTSAGAELQAGDTTAEGCAADGIADRQLCRQEADQGLRASSGMSVAPSDQSNVTRASAEVQEREQLLRRAAQRRVVGEVAALAACVAAGCVKRAALYPLQRLILNTLQHWQQKLEPMPREHQRVDGLEAQGKEEIQRPLQEIQVIDTAERVWEAGAPLRSAFRQKASAAVQCDETQRTSQIETSSVNIVHGNDCMSVPLAELLRGSLPPCSEATAARGFSNMGRSPGQCGVREYAQQPHGLDGSTTSHLNCVRITLFASKQVLRWRHLRQRVTLFTEKTSPYYFWPPWGGFRTLVEKGGSALSSKLLMSEEMDGTDSDVGRPTSARQMDVQHKEAEGEPARIRGGVHDLGSLPQNAGKGGEFNSSECATPSSRGKARLTDERERVSEAGTIDDKRSPVNRVKLLTAAQSCIAESGSTYGTPTKSRPDFTDAEIHRDTTATRSSPPALGEGNEFFSPVSASVQQHGCHSLHRSPEQDVDGWHQGASGNSIVSGAKDASGPSPAHASASSTHAAASSTQARESRSTLRGQGNCVEVRDVRCTTGAAAAALGTCETKAGLNKEGGTRVSTRDQTSSKEGPDLCRVCAKDATYNECSTPLSYKDKHAIVPFLPNVLACRRAIRTTSYCSTAPPGPLRLPFEETGTVYVLCAESDDTGSSTSEAKSERQPNCPPTAHEADNPHTQEALCGSSVSDACAKQKRNVFQARNACRGFLQDVSVSNPEGEGGISSKRGMSGSIPQSSGSILAVWACTARSATPSEKTGAPTSKNVDSSTTKNAACQKAVQKRFWLCDETLGDLLRAGERKYNAGRDTVSDDSRVNEALQGGTDVCTVPSPRSLTRLDSASKPEVKAVLPGASCHPQGGQTHRSWLREGHQKKAEEVTKAMQTWCQATSRSGVDQNSQQYAAAGSLKVISLESFASAYNDLAEEAVKQLLTQIRTRGEHSLPPAACHPEENARVASRGRREDARCLQQQLRTKLQQLVQNYNRLVTVEHNSADQNSSPDRDQVDASQSSGHEHLEHEFQQRLRDLQQRVEYHLHQHRQLAGSLRRRGLRQGRRRRGSGTQQVSGGRRRLPRRRLQWYSVGIRWLRTGAALEYFVVRHRQRDVGQSDVHGVLGDFASRLRRMQRPNQENVDGPDGQPSPSGLAGETGLPLPSNGTPSATCPPSHNGEDRPIGRLKRRQPGSPPRRSSSSCEGWKTSEQSTGQQNESGATCASGRSSICGDEENRKDFYFPTVPRVGPVGMSPVTVSEVSTPLTCGTPPLSSNEEAVYAESPKGAFRQQGSGAHTGMYNHTNSVLLLHELLQPTRLDAGGIRAALVLVVFRLRRFIRVVRKKDHADIKEKEDVTACKKSRTAHEHTGMAHRVHGRADRDIRSDVNSADAWKASQDSVTTRAKISTSGREGLSLRAQLSELTRLQNDFTELPTTGSKRPWHSRKHAGNTFVCDEVSGGQTSQRVDLRTPPESEVVPATVADTPLAGTESQSKLQPRAGRDEPTQVEERLHEEANSVLPVQRQVPWSSIRMALVLPNLGVQLQQILPSTRSVGGDTWMGGEKDAVVDRDTPSSAQPGLHSGYALYGRDGLPRRGGEAFAALSQTSQQLDSRSQSPVPRRLGVPGVMGSGDAAEARAARAAARAAAAETRSWRQREREEAETRAGGLSDNAVYSGESSVGPGRGERSRTRSSPEPSSRKADGDGDEDEEDTSGEPRSATNSGASARMYGKHGELEIQSGQLGLIRTPSPQLPQRVRRSCGITSSGRGDVSVKRKQLGPGSDEDADAADSADGGWRTHARAIGTENDGEGTRLPPVKGGALEPFWWRACCARFHDRMTQSPNEERTLREQSLKTSCSSEVMGDGSQPTVDAGNEDGAGRQWDGKSIIIAEGRETLNVTSDSGRDAYPCGAEAGERATDQENVKRTQRLHGAVGTSSSSQADSAILEQTLHMVPSCPPLPASSSSELTSSDEESGSDRSACTTSESSGWSTSSSGSSDVSVEASTVLQQLSARRVAADTTCWSSRRQVPLAGQIPLEKCSSATDDFLNGSLLKTVQADICNGGSTPVAEPAEPSADVESVVVTTPAAHERGHHVTEESGSAGFHALSGTSVRGKICARYSVGRRSRSCIDQYSGSAGTRSALKCRATSVPVDDTKMQSLNAGECRELAEHDLLQSKQAVSCAAPHLIVMPREESVSADLRRMLPQLRVRFTTCAVDLTSKKEREVLQTNGKRECVTLRPRRAVRRLWNALHPILHTLQMFNWTEEGRGGWVSIKSSGNLNTPGEGLADATDTDGLQVVRSTETRADLLCSAILSAAADIVRDSALPHSMDNTSHFDDQISEKERIRVSRLANTLAHGWHRHVDSSFPQQITTLLSQRIHRREGVTRRAEGTKQIEKLKKVIADGILYLSGVLDVETGQVEAAKEKAGDDALLSLLRFPSAPGAVSRAPADLDDAVERDIGAGFPVANRGVVDLSPREGGTEGKWRKKKRMKIEAGPRSFSTDTPGGELLPIKPPPDSLVREDHWEASDFSESLPDFGSKTTSAGEASSKVILRCPRAFGRRMGGIRRPRLPGARSGLQGDLSSAFGTKDDRGAEATWEYFSQKELRRGFRFPGRGDEGVTGRGWEWRGRTPTFLRPDGWEAMDDESASSSSAEKTSAYAPVSSGSESVYLSVPSSPRRRRQQRQLRWRSRHLTIGTSGAYLLTSPELPGDFDCPKRAYGGRTPRRAGMGSVLRVFQNSPTSTGGTMALQASFSTQPFSPPLTRGAAATMPGYSQMYTRADALSAGQGDATTQSECTTRERRRTTQQDRLFSPYLPEKLSKRQFAAASSSQARRKSSVGRMQRNRTASVSAAPSLDWSGPELSLTTPSRKKVSSGTGGASQSTPKSHSSAGGTRHHLASSEGASAGSPAAAFARSATTAVARGSNLDSPRETPRPGRRTPTAGSPVPTGVYFDASRKLWRCQWRENGRFKTKGFSLNTYGTLKDARKACIEYRCRMGGWAVEPQWLADNDSQDSGDNGLSEGHALQDEDNVSRSRAPGADGSQSEVEQGEVGDVAQSVAAASIPTETADASEAARAHVAHCDGGDSECHGTAVSGDGETGPTGHANAGDSSCSPSADPVTPAGASP